MRSPLPRQLAALCSLVAALLTLDSTVALATPNVLFLLTDDQRPDSIHALGNERIETPNLDRLVREGTTFTRAIVASDRPAS